MFSNVFCVVMAFGMAYQVFDGFRQGSVRMKNGGRADRANHPYFFWFMTVFYSAITLAFIAMPIAGIDIFDG